MTRRRAKPQEPLERDRRAAQADRRDDAARHSLEMPLDRCFRPARWASRLCYALGLQSARPIVVAEHTVRVAREAGRPPLRIAFASDFHAGATTDVRVLRAATAALDALAPDLLLLGGDFVSVRGSDVAELAPLLASVRAPLGKFGV